jgi:hypothetical protein
MTGASIGILGVAIIIALIDISSALREIAKAIRARGQK